MNLIKWRESYSTGVEQFDTEHHKIIDLINEMYKSVRDNGSREEVEKLLKDLVSYTESHFANEEAMMEASSFSELDEHRLEHDRLKGEITKFHELLEEDLVSGTRQLYRFLREWLTNHILECDMKYSGKLNAN